MDLKILNNKEELKRRLDQFTAEMLRMGSLQGFALISMYLRGKEELVLNVKHSQLESDTNVCPPTPHLPRSGELPQPCQLTTDSSFNSLHLPYDERSLLLSQRTQKHLSGYAFIDVGLPPASPCDSENMTSDEHSTLFLLGAYVRYHSPYVWVRSNHARIVQLTGEASESRDHPLKIKSTIDWARQNSCPRHIVAEKVHQTNVFLQLLFRVGDSRPWHIVAEVVKLCTYPPPRNPFALDFNLLQSAPCTERLVLTAALMHFLQKVVMTTEPDKYYVKHVLDEYEQLVSLHLETVAAGSAPNLDSG